MRLIDADKLTRPEIIRMYYYLPNGDTAIPIIDIEHAPTVDAVPVVHGRWEKTNNPSYSPFDGSSEHLSICSNCAYSREQHDFLYCPNCGAKMDLEEQDAQTDQPGK